MNKKQRLSAIGALLCASCLAVSVGVANYTISAEPTTQPISSLVTADTGVTVEKREITAKHYSRASGQETNNGTTYSYTGLVVESDRAYSGEFSGVFKGDTTLEYKFFGQNPFKTYFKCSTAIGDFHIKITSVANPTQWVQANYEPKSESATNHGKDLKMYFTGSTFGEKVVIPKDNNASASEEKDRKDFLDVHARQCNSGFLSDSVNANDKLYIELDADENMSIYYQAINQDTGGILSKNEKSAAMVTLNGGNSTTKAKMDWSEGYTISFSSAVDTNRIYDYAGDTYTPTDGGTDVCFISMNGKALDTDSVSMESSTLAMLDDIVLDKDVPQDVFQNADHTLYSVNSGILYQGEYTCFDGTEKNGSFTLQSKISAGELDTATLGNNKTVTVAGVTYRYNVVGGVAGKDLVGVNVTTERVSATYRKHTGDNVASEYEGLTITADKAYEGAFDGVFYGNTALEYKFPGTTSLATKGDALGNFYFLIKSVNNPSQWIKINIAQQRVVSSNPYEYYADKSLIYAESSLYKIDSQNLTALKNNGINWAADDFQDVSQWVTAAPTFRSDARETTESLYFETQGDFFYVYYQKDGDANGVKTENPLVAFEKYKGANGNWEEEKDCPYDNFISDLFDFSKGYTIEFGSNFDKNTNFSTTVAEDVMPDAGTDVCFISVNGVCLSDKQVKVNSLTYTDEVKFDGKAVEGALDLVGKTDKTFDVTTKVVSSENYTVAGVTCPLNYSKTATGLAWSAKNLSEDKLTLNTGLFGNREITVAVIENSGTGTMEYTYTLVVGGTSTDHASETAEITLPTATSEGKVLVGWKTATGALYPVGGKYTLTANSEERLTAAFVAFDMANGASIRLSEPYGLRFVSGYNAADFASLSDFASVGTLIAPTDSLNGAELNHTNFTATGSNPTMLDIEGSNSLSEAAAKAALAAAYSNEYTYFTGTITNLKEANFARRFSARAYVKVTYTDGKVSYFYSEYDETNNARSAYDVAVAAKAAGETGVAFDKYIDQTEDLTITDVNTTEYEITTKITSVRVNGVWVSATVGAKVKIGDKQYNVTYGYDEENGKLTLTFDESDD